MFNYQLCLGWQPFKAFDPPIFFNINRGSSIYFKYCAVLLLALLLYIPYDTNDRTNCPNIHSYRVKVVAQDSSGSATFTLFRNQVEQLVGVPIEKVMGEIGQVH